MGIELPRDIQEMVIPAHMDSRGTASSITTVFDEADVRKAERAATQDAQIEDYHISTMSAEKAEGTGRIGNAASALAQREEVARQAEKDNRDRTDTMILLSTLDRRIAELDTQIAQYEERFEQRFGDAWREEIAVRVLDEDEMPERREGESMSDYRERVEDAIVDKMIDPETGKMRPEYRDHPEFKEYGEWAEREYERDKAMALKKEIPTASPERLAEIDTQVREQYSINLNNQLEQELATLEIVDDNSAAILEATEQTTNADISETVDEANGNLDNAGGLFGGFSPN